MKPSYPFHGMNNEEIDVALSLWAGRATPKPPVLGLVRVTPPGGTYPPAQERAA